MYATNFEQGEAGELFVWQVKMNGAQLIKHNINSKEFLLKMSLFSRLSTSITPLQSHPPQFPPTNPDR